MGAPFDKMELASFLSCSKGYMGECGIRGGYAEIVNMDKDVKAMLQKSISAKLCPTVIGQVRLLLFQCSRDADSLVLIAMTFPGLYGCGRESTPERRGIL